ncbi:hypothetical protein [Nocardioides sp. CFH 31398]|uniref:hypothetical protein n=1 Tax=Nocardioides sp. CFH 31398 TaxID=2919579 RepID=UPI001F06D990|nr:hypothetical protein [Nocardioides sp. CFH 31398]MCH1865665.1 hypothetical protein [Nocardioides sp. CFH 31398]
MRPRRRRQPCPGADTANNNGAPEPAATGGGDLRTQVLMFAHLAQVALTLSSLSARRRDEVQDDLAVLRTECDRGRVRPAVVTAVVDSVIEVMSPELPLGVARSLAEARPEPGAGPEPVGDPVPGLDPSCLT